MEYFDYLKNIIGLELNSQQINAASFDKGNALVLSTAGSGKLLLSLQEPESFYMRINAAKILTITFSKMAANDMKERFESCFGRNYEAKTEFSTIHAFSYKIVRDLQKKGH